MIYSKLLNIICDQRHGCVCRGPDRSNADSQRVVGEHRSEEAQAAISDEGAAVGVAAAVKIAAAWLHKWSQHA